MEAIAASFALVAASEMGDKTQLLAFWLASRYRRPWTILAGVFVATVLNHGLASTAGVFLAREVPTRGLHIGLGALFIGFGIWTLQPDSLERTARSDRFGPFLTTVGLFFIAEMGDKTQLATVALAARFQSIALVTVGTTCGMLLSDGLAIFLGDQLAGRVQARWIRWASAALFFAFGAVLLFDGLRGLR